ncbi:hypothetical protein BDN72DRAFT_958955 [Pluteus cervinus]|uniref:Uncharacterized protein n=1 Tax=Pluteus cervinus TaxID=181527 RepID=A0ACD3AZ52_9AGAR|nr:hypothetical protein BDN72DRAFT_958955 [Pluteus cervinus]
MAGGTLWTANVAVNGRKEHLLEMLITSRTTSNMVDATFSSQSSSVEGSQDTRTQFRILVVGNTGVGKSSLISNVFNVSSDDVDVAHDHIGRSNITIGYTCKEDPRFILHDSQGFEPGATENWDLVKQFLHERSARPKVEDRVHAIWLCIITPRTGSRLQQSGDEMLLALAEKLRIPVIVVFTKFDLLVNEHQWKTRVLRGEARIKAEVSLRTRLTVERFPSAEVRWVRISTKPDFVETLRQLTEGTQECLNDTEGELWLPWAAARLIKAHHPALGMASLVQQNNLQLEVPMNGSRLFHTLPRAFFTPDTGLPRIRQSIKIEVLAVAHTTHDPHHLESGGMNSADLPSRVEESLTACPQFRILVVGNTGVGKSSLISSIFNLSINDIDVAHDRAGRADISFGYTCEENPRFILHDSQGFEPGATESWEFVKRFLCERSARPAVRDHVHAIWLCIATPRTGMRLQQTGDEKLLALAEGLSIPLIVVFTKFDLLVSEHKRKLKLSPDDARAKAEQTLQTRLVEDKFGINANCVRISTKASYVETLRELTDVTRQGLRDIEGELWLPWAAAQQINARQKVEQSIREGCKKYWLNLGTSATFKGQVLLHCIWRIYEDIIKVWNFHDPRQLLYKNDFFAQTLKLVEDFTPQSEAEMAAGGDSGGWLSQYTDVMTMATAIGTTFAQALGGIGIGILALKYIHRTYQALPQTARFLGVYIIDVTIILHHVFLTTLSREPPRPLTDEILEDALMTYEMQDRANNHSRIRKTGVVNFEQQVASLIQESLR